MLTCSYLREILHYNPATGVFTWKRKSKSIREDGIAGTITDYGYINISIDCKLHRAHRLAWLYLYGYMPDKIDHKNRNPADNRIDNLRPCDNRTNAANSKLRKDNKTGLKGVSFCTASGKYVANITISGKLKYLGSFRTKEDAHAVYVKAGRREFGEFFSDGS